MFDGFLNLTQIRPDYSSPPPGLTWRSSKLFIISTIGVGLFADLFLYSLLIPVFPFRLAELGYDQSQIQSLTSALLATMAVATGVMSVAVGIVADLVTSRKGPFLSGLAMMLAATILFFVAESVWLMFVARALQGASAACIWVLGIALCLDTVGSKNMGKTMGPMWAIVSFATVAGPFIGGALYHLAGYGGVFALAVSVTGLDLIMRVSMIDRKTLARYEAVAREDGYYSAGVPESLTNERQPLLEDQTDDAAVRDGTDESQSDNGDPDDDDDDDITDWEISKEQPLICRLYKVLPCLASTRLQSSMIFTVVLSCILGSLDATVPIVSWEYFGFNSLQAGLLFTPILAFDIVVSYPSGWCIDRYGPKWPAVVGFGLTAPVLVALRLVHPGGTDQITLYACLLGLIGLALAAVGPASIAETAIVSTKYEKANPDYFGENGAGCGMYSFGSAVHSIGLTVGPELASVLRLRLGYGNMNLVFAGIALFGAAHCYLFMGGKPRWFRKMLGEVMT